MFYSHFSVIQTFSIIRYNFISWNPILLQFIFYAVFPSQTYSERFCFIQISTKLCLQSIFSDHMHGADYAKFSNFQSNTKASTEI